MARILLDTNVLVCLSNPGAPQREACRNYLTSLMAEGHKPVFCTQVVYEFWTVATRPTPVNGLGWAAMKARFEIELFSSQFALLHDTPEVFALWLNLVTAHNLKGKRIHDAHILATMQAHGVAQILTFNTSDFPPVDGITILTPAQS